MTYTYKTLIFHKKILISDTFSKVIGYKENKIQYIIYTNKKHTEKEIRKVYRIQ